MGAAALRLIASYEADIAKLRNQVSVLTKERDEMAKERDELAKVIAARSQSDEGPPPKH